MFVTVHSRHAYKVIFPHNLWLPSIYQQSFYEVVFSTIYFGVYKYILTKWKGVTYIRRSLSQDYHFDI